MPGQNFDDVCLERLVLESFALIFRIALVLRSEWPCGFDAAFYYV